MARTTQAKVASRHEVLSADYTTLRSAMVQVGMPIAESYPASPPIIDTGQLQAYVLDMQVMIAMKLQFERLNLRRGANCKGSEIKWQEQKKQMQLKLLK